MRPPTLDSSPRQKAVERWLAGVIRTAGAVVFIIAALFARGAPTTAPLEAETEALKEIEELRGELKRHDGLYHEAAPEITDAEYDELQQELAELESRQSQKSPTGGDDNPSALDLAHVQLPTGFAQHRHLERMLSLEKAYSESDLREFYARIVRRLGHLPGAFVVEPKFDGLAVSATYEDGKLVRLVTRGDGDRGDDISVHLPTIRGLPSELTASGGGGFPRTIEVRGEVYLSLAEFKRLNQERDERGEPSYASPRNLAAGTLKSLAPNAEYPRTLDVVFYGVGGCHPDSARPQSQRELLRLFSKWGLPTVVDFQVAGSIDAIWTAAQSIGAARERFSFPIDGAVVKVDALEDQLLLGVTERAPRWAIAYKFAPERQSTRLRAITLQVGRSGLITPVAELEPVRLAGALISRATLHNADEISRRDLRIGDFVILQRAGEVIPSIVGVDLSRRNAAARRYEFPSTCPACGARLVQRTGQVAWRCLNLDCRGQLKRRIQHFASPACVGIHGLSETMIDRLIETGRLSRVSDLYRLKRDDFALHRSTAATHALLENIEQSKQAEFWRVLFGLGLPGVGAVSAKALGQRFDNLSVLARVNREVLADVSGLSSEAVEAIVDFFSSTTGRELLADFAELGIGSGGSAGR